MNRYKVFSFLYFLAILAFSLYKDLVYIYLIPIGLLSLWIYARGKGFFLYLAGAASLSCLAILLLYRSLGYFYIPFAIPLLLLSIESCFKDDVAIEGGGIEVWHFSSNSLYLVMLSLVILFLSILNFSLVIFPATVFVYLLMLLVIYNRRLSRLVLSGSGRFVVVREQRALYHLSLKNGGKTHWNIYIDDYKADGYTIAITPNNIILREDEEFKIDMYIDAILIGNYDITLNIVVRDVRYLFKFNTLFRARLLVKPKIAVSVEMAKRLLEAYGGRGELEEYAYIEGHLGKSRAGLFFGVRPFIQGDDPRSIHFKKSVEHHSLVIKEFESAGFQTSMLLSDVSVATPEDLDDVLDGTIRSLVDYFTLGFNNVGILMFNSEDVMISLPPSNPLIALKMVIGKIEDVKLESFRYRYILDMPNVYALMRSKHRYARIELLFLKERFKSSILGKVNKLVSSMTSYPIKILIISKNSRFRHLYPLFRYILEKEGHRLTKALEEPLKPELSR